MCGLAGVFTKYNFETKKIKNIVSEMATRLKHRGPDSNGIYTTNKFSVGFQRLSILDTSSKANQPFTDKKKNYILAFNGEIYNYLEIKKKYLHNLDLKSNSDTEVLFHLLIKFGARALEKIEGMYAFAFYNKEKDKLILARDHCGMKPLYYSIQERKIFFSSEVKALKKVVNFKINNNKLLENMLWGNIAGEETLYKDIFEVKPGYFYEVDHKFKLKKNKFFDLKKTFSNEVPEIKLIEKKLLETVDKHLRSDVKMGILLSGGLDSSILTSLVTKIKKKKNINTFSTSIPNSKFDETKYQNKVKNLFGTLHKKFDFTQLSIIKNLEKCIYFYESPLHHPNIMAIYELCGFAKRNKVKVLISGDGADELFGGYRWSYQYNKVNQIFSNSTFNHKIIKKVFNIKNCKFKIRQNLLVKNSEKKIFQRLYDQSFYLDKWLQRQDRMGMSSSIEIRVPFCDIGLTQLVNKYDHQFKIGKKFTKKYILKKISEKYLPKNVVHQKKKGFTIPLDDWFRKQLLQKFFRKILRNKVFLNRKIYKHKNIESIFNEHINYKKNHGKILWLIVNFEIWQRIFIDKKSSQYKF